MPTRIQDVIVPEIFTPYVMNRTMELSALVQSGAMVMSPELSALLAGGGLTFNQPFWKDLANDPDNVSSDDPSQKSTPYKNSASSEVQVRLNRNNSWSTMDLTGQLAGSDPMTAIANRVAAYWVRRLQQAFIATQNGVYAMNDAAPTGGSTHTQKDMSVDITGASFVDGVTNFTAEAFIDCQQTMGDAQDLLTLCAVHSVVFSRMKKNNLIDFIPDAVNPNAERVPTFLGRRVVVDDGIPNAGGVFSTYLYASGAYAFGQSAPPVATETDRLPDSGNGAGQDVLYNRHQWCLHPVGHAYVGTAPNGGPSNANTANNLANAASWVRRFPERKQIRMARLLTREY